MRATATISKANHYFRINGFYEEFAVRVILPFCKLNLCKMAKKPIPGTRKQAWFVQHVFARSNYDKSEYRLPIETLKEFVEFAGYRGYKESRLKIQDEPEIEGKDVVFEFNPGFDQFREGQGEWIDYMLSDGHLKVNNASTGFGKAQSLSSKIKVPGGWKRMGDIQVGDLVIARDGSATPVTGVFPQGVTEVWRVHFADGRHTDVNPDHLWNIFDHAKRSWKTLDTRVVKALLESSPGRVYVPLCEPEDGPAKAFKIHPYLMGVLLGDGGFTNGNVTVNKPYEQIFEKISSLLPDHLTCKWRDDVTFVILFKDRRKPGEDQWHVRTGLKEHGLMGLKSHEKFVPAEYLEGSAQQRLELLQGLLDTDGYVSKGKSVSFSSSSEKLALAVQYLVRSLGGIAKIVSRIPTYTYLGEKKQGRTDYRVSIRYPRPEELFTLEHKRERAAGGQYSDTLKLKVVKIEELASAPTQCISVDHPEHLYVTDDFIVTHNTYMAIHSMVKIGKRTLITMQPRYQINWIRELNKIVKLIPGDLLIWENTLESLYECLEDGKFDPKIIIIPMSRIEVFLRKGKETRDGLHMDDLIKRINPGLRIIDEGHEAIHQIFLSLMFGNIKKLFLLSATLKADDPFTNKMYQYLFPKRLRLKEAEPEHYIDVVAYLYRLNTRRYHLKTEQFGAYNDKTFEKSILKSGVLLAFYFKLVNKAFKEYYLNVRREGTKCLFFFSRVSMCDAMLELFRKEYPGWDFETFTGDDSKLKDKKDKYLKHEIIITTPNSCGTGKDIGGLVTVICAHTVASTQANKQIIGRLRALSGKFNNEIDPAFVFLVCLDLVKHVEYLAKREQVFFEKQKTFKRINSECSLD